MEHVGAGLGDWLVEHGRKWERDEADWLLGLVAFDRSQAWAADGQSSCVRWVMWKMHMARSTAFEKLRVGYALDRRPVLLAAFRDGRISYSALRLMASLEDPDEAVDAALVAVASAQGASIGDVEQMVRVYLKHADQDKPPPDPDKRRRVSIRRHAGDGMSQITIVLSDLETDEFIKVLNAFDDPLFRQACTNEKRGHSVHEPTPAKPGDESTAADDRRPAEPEDESAGADSPAGGVESDGAARRADAFMNLLAAAISEDGSRAGGDDRYMVHVVTVVGSAGATTIDGEALSVTETAMIDCDCSKVTHLITEQGEPLHLGRKTREWTTAQRRAVNVRDGGHCRFPGCPSRYVDIHHIQWWEHQGPTDIDNAMNCCRHHHTMIHSRRIQVDGDPNDGLRFYRQDGTPIGTTHPALTTRVKLPIAS